MASDRTVEILDRHYAHELGCSPEDLSSGRLIVVESELRGIKFAKGVPLALLSLSKAGGAVISVGPGMKCAVTSVIDRCGARELDDAACGAIERGVTPLIDVRFWFRGVRLFCEPTSFVDGSSGDVREVLPSEDEHALLLHGRWGGKVFGQIADGKAVAWTAVKPLSDVIWDLSVETLAEYRGRGYAKSVVSAAVKHIFESGKIAGWGTDRDNMASLRTAQAVGFQHYALDFGCVEREP